jgi:hypothetical protein
MISFRIGLILTVFGCSDPTANYQTPIRPATLEATRQSNSYSLSSFDGTVQVRIASVRGSGGEKIHEFMKRVFESADAAGSTRLVLDLRAVSGSDTFLVVPLLKGVIARDKFRAPGGLVVVVGPDSFSPTQNAATLLLQYANPVFSR